MGCTGSANFNSLIETEPQLVQTVEHGQKYIIPYDGRDFFVLNLTGSAYQMGLAQGTLMKEEIPQLVDKFFEWAALYIEKNISTIIARLPKFMRIIIGEAGVKLARFILDINYYVVKKYTPRRFDDELRGISDGCGVPVQTLRQINIIPELLKAHCSVFGAYGSASKSGKLLHLRSLDWDEHAPQSMWPSITIYHSNEVNSVPFANIGWPAFIGTITGYNSMKVGIGERAGDDPSSQESRLGTPWNFVLRDALQFSKSQKEAIQFLIDAQRTCSIFLGVGGENYFEICEYVHDHLYHYDWKNWHFDENHPITQDSLWKAFKDNEACFKNIVQSYYGEITPETIYKYMAPMAQTGDSQTVVMDYSDDTVYCAYPNPKTFQPGYIRPFVKIDLKPFFNSNNNE